MRNNKRLIQAAKALRKTGFHFDQLQFAGIQRNMDGKFSECQGGDDLAEEFAAGLFSSFG